METEISVICHSNQSFPQIEVLVRNSLFPERQDSRTIRFEVSGQPNHFEVAITTRPAQEWEAFPAHKDSREGVRTSLPWSSTAELNEAISWALLETQLCHPNIAELVDFQVTAESVTSMRALEGLSVVSRGEPYTEREVFQLVLDVSGALIYANNLGVALSTSEIVEKEGRFVVGGGVLRGKSTNQINELEQLVRKLPIDKSSEELGAFLDLMANRESSLIQAHLRACSFLTPHISSAPCQELTCFTNRRMLHFDFSRRDWHKSIMLSRYIQYLECSRCYPYSPTLLAVCGLSENELRGCCLVDRQGVVESLPNNVYGRGYAGLMASEGVLYAFGGWNPSSCNLNIALSLKSAEQIRPKIDSHWLELPSMSIGHSCFNPVHWLDSIFLCGGNTNAIEVFHPESLSYSLLAWRLPEGLGPALAVLNDRTLIVVTSNALSLVHPSLLLQSVVHERNYPYSNAYPTLHEGGIYYTQEVKWMVVDSQTGEARLDL